MAKKYKTMNDAAKALEGKGVDICGSNYSDLSTKDKNKVLEVMGDAKTYRHRGKNDLSRGEDFYNKMGKYGSCDVD